MIAITTVQLPYFLVSNFGKGGSFTIQALVPTPGVCVKATLPFSLPPPFPGCFQTNPPVTQLLHEKFFTARGPFSS